MVLGWVGELRKDLTSKFTCSPTFWKLNYLGTKFSGSLVKFIITLFIHQLFHKKLTGDIERESNQNWLPHPGSETSSMKMGKQYRVSFVIMYKNNIHISTALFVLWKIPIWYLSAIIGIYRYFLKIFIFNCYRFDIYCWISVSISARFKIRESFKIGIGKNRLKRIGLSLVHTFILLEAAPL